MKEEQIKEARFETRSYLKEKIKKRNQKSITITRKQIFIRWKTHFPHILKVLRISRDG
jgi:hypothetical protein